MQRWHERPHVLKVIIVLVYTLKETVADKTLLSDRLLAGMHAAVPQQTEDRTMVTEADPILENWYQHLDKGQKFRVVALNEDEGLVELQYFDGDLEEIDVDGWYQLEIEPIEPPENWSGPLDIAEIDDLGTEITDTTAEDWVAPLTELKPAQQDSQWEESEQGDAGDYERMQEEPWQGEL